MLTPILLKRKQTKENNKSLPISRSHTPNSVKNMQNSEFPLKLETLCINSSVFETKVVISKENNEEKPFFYKKNTQPSFGAEEDPVFLSERVSNESDQSLKFEKWLPNITDSSECFESMNSSYYQEIEKADNQTQTEGQVLLNVLKSLDDNEIKSGIKFISQIAQFMKTLK